MVIHGLGHGTGGAPDRNCVIIHAYTETCEYAPHIVRAHVVGVRTWNRVAFAHANELVANMKFLSIDQKNIRTIMKSYYELG